MPPTITLQSAIGPVVGPQTIYETFAVTPKTIRLWILKGRFPRPAFGSGRGRRWRAADIERFQQSERGDA
jgi:DNA-binding transcriptional MerR regulator